MNDMTIAFIGFDGYNDLWDDCINLFKKNWPDCPYKTLFVNNVLEKKWNNINTINAGEGAEWSQKVLKAIENSSTKYICLLLEDFFIGSKIDQKIIAESMDYIYKNNIKYYKLANLSRFTKNKDKKIKNYSYLHVIPKNDEYGISLQAAIWDKEYLKELVGNRNYNAWKFEFNMVKMSDGASSKPHDNCVFDVRNILNLKHGVVQSKYIPDTLEYFNSIGYQLNIKREVMSKKEYNKIKRISNMKDYLPRFMRKPIKRLMEKFGHKFVSTQRDK